MDQLSATEMALRVGAALLCGAMVGIERERYGREMPAVTLTLVLLPRD